jgi:hypothetical protein
MKKGIVIIDDLDSPETPKQIKAAKKFIEKISINPKRTPSITVYPVKKKK